MTAIALERESNNYWDLIKNVSPEVKIVLISRLSNALMTEAAAKRERVGKLMDAIEANAPKDVPLTDEEIMDEVRAVRYAQ